MGKVKVNAELFRMLEESKFWFGLENYKYELFKMALEENYFHHEIDLKPLKFLKLNTLESLLELGYELELSKEERTASVCDVYREISNDFDKGFIAGVTYLANEYEIKIPRINC